MAIPVTEKRSPGWWMKRLSAQLEARRPKLDILDDWYRGDAPIAKDDEQRLKHKEMTRQSQTSFAALAVDSKRERMRVRAIRTSVDNDLEGDQVAWALWRASNLQVEVPNLLRMMLALRSGCVIVGMPDADSGRTDPLATVEDPRDVITVPDPLRPGRALAALSLKHDDVEERDEAVLWLPGEKFVATRPRRVSPRVTARRPVFSPSAYDLDEGRYEEWDKSIGVPVIEIVNQDGMGEFEKHLGTLERIDRGTFRRDTIALLQAFRQRALIGDEPDDVEDDRAPHLLDADGTPVVTAERARELDDVLSADPGAVWTVPEGMKFWESGQVDLTPLQVSKRDDVKEFAAVTRTPLSMITPDAAAQSAEGASLQREGHVYAVEDRRTIAGTGLSWVTSLLLDLAGHTDRADPTGIVVEWMPAERHSLGERGTAAVAAKNSGVPWSTRMSDIWGFDPEKVERMRDERLDDLLFDVNAAQPPATDPVLAGA